MRRRNERTSGIEEKEVKRKVNKYEKETKTLMQRREKKGRETDENDPIISLRERDRYIQDVFKKSDKKRKRGRVVSSGGLRWRQKRERISNDSDCI